MRRDAPPDGARSWYGTVVDYLIELRRAEGPDFERHWGLAMRRHPPRGRDASPATPRLFDETGGKPDTLLAFFKRVTESAYCNERGPAGSGIGPALGYFRGEMVRHLDDSAPARRASGSSRAFRSAA